MTKCLVTKYEGVCSNEYLPKLGQFRIKVYSGIEPKGKCSLDVSKNTSAQIIGNGYFTDSSFTVNNGKTLDLVSGQNDFYVSCTEDCYLDIKDKDALTRIISIQQNLGFDLADVKYSNITYIWSMENNAKITGSIDNLANATDMSLLIIVNTDVYGDIGSLKGLTKLQKLNLSNSSVKGDIGVVKNFQNLSLLGLNNTNVSGDIGVIKNLGKISSSMLQINTSGKLYGNLGSIPDSILVFYTNSQSNSSVFTWDSSDRENILAMSAVRCSNIDDLLNGMQGLTAKFDEVSKPWSTYISLIGTRTSASDAAVATLQSKGYTVSITPA